MAKRKKQKVESEKKHFSYANEVIGLILILFSITGLGAFGLVGGLVKKFAIFMFGSWSFLFLFLTLGLGIYMIIRRGKPSYFNGRLIGIYAIILCILLLSHIKYISGSNIESSKIIPTTLDNIESACELINYDSSDSIISKIFSTSGVSETGGGMVGALFSFIFVSLFAVEGTCMLIVIIAIFGFIMLFDITLSDILNKIKSIFVRKKVSNDDEDDVSEEDDEKVTYEEDDEPTEVPAKENKLVITSIEDLEPHKEETRVEDVPIIDNSSSENDVYIKPSTALLDPPKRKSSANANGVVEANIQKLEGVFGDFDIHAKVIEVHVGPAVTQYEMRIDKGTRVNKVLGISREIALALAAKEVRIEAPIPGKDTVGVEIPNQNIMAVSMREIMESKEITSKPDSKLLAPLGRDINGKVKCVEINKTPHMLVAGATGSGKSVCINNIILAIIMRTTPDEVKMVLVDPKKVEFNVYEGIPHLLTPVVTDPKKASAALQKIVVEMDDRYEIFKNSGTKNIATYNEYVDKELQRNPDCGLKHMPFILVIIDELADLMLVAAKEVEDSIMRITQLARAAGIHLIVATQRPSTDVITGVVKSNIPTRISFAVSSSIDSRTILDMTGAEKLLGKGDMLYKPMDDNTPTRVQGSFVSDDEIKRVVDFIKKKSSGPRYNEKFNNLEQQSSGGSGASGGTGGSSGDEVKDVLYDDILEYAIRMGQISASLIQRKYSIGYNRAARIIDLFEERGIVGPAKGSKPRDVLVKLEENKEE